MEKFKDLFEGTKKSVNESNYFVNVEYDLGDQGEGPLLVAPTEINGLYGANVVLSKPAKSQKWNAVFYGYQENNGEITGKELLKKMNLKWKITSDNGEEIEAEATGTLSKLQKDIQKAFGSKFSKEDIEEAIKWDEEGY